MKVTNKLNFRMFCKKGYSVKQPLDCDRNSDSHQKLQYLPLGLRCWRMTILQFEPVDAVRAWARTYHVDRATFLIYSVCFARSQRVAIKMVQAASASIDHLQTRTNNTLEPALFELVNSSSEISLIKRGRESFFALKTCFNVNRAAS